MNPSPDLLIDRSRVRLFPRFFDIHDVTENVLIHALADENPVLCPNCLELLDEPDLTPGASFKHQCLSCRAVTSDPVKVVFDTDYEP